MKERNRETLIVFFPLCPSDHLWLIAGTDSRMNSRSSVTDQPFFSSSTHPLRQGTNIWHAIKLGALLLLAQFEEAEIIRNWLHFRPPTRLLDPLFSWTEHQTDFKWELSVSVLLRENVSCTDENLFLCKWKADIHHSFTFTWNGSCSLQSPSPSSCLT